MSPKHESVREYVVLVAAGLCDHRDGSADLRADRGADENRSAVGAGALLRGAYHPRGRYHDSGLNKIGVKKDDRIRKKSVDRRRG